MSHKFDILWDIGQYSHMAEGVNVRFAGELQRFIQSKTEKSGLYSSASEYIRDLVRRDYESEESRKLAWLVHELTPGVAVDDSEFVVLDTEALLAEAKSGKPGDGN